MRWLRGGVNDYLRVYIGYEAEQAVPIPDIDIEVRVIRQSRGQPVERPAGIAFRSEKYRALIIVDTKYLISAAAKPSTYFRADQTARTRN